MADFGYVRVSTREQRTDRQIIAMQELGIEKSCLYIDKQSGKDFHRPAYNRMVKKLREGDILFVKSIDRLGRNYEEIIQQWRVLTRHKKIEIVVIDFPLLDTRRKDNDVTGVFIADLVLQILSYVAQIERENIKQRQSEGIAAAKSKGIRFGRPEKPIPEEFYEIYEQWKIGYITAKDASSTLQVDHKTFKKWIFKTKKEREKKRKVSCI